MRLRDKIITRLLNGTLNLIIIIILILAGSFSIFALWDNNRVYEKAENVQEQMLKFKPSVEDPQNASEQFAALKEINSDVRAWITLDGTQIDYPVLQGSDNYTYVNKDVYGNYALAGSIFLDSANDPDFNDAYSLLYGHHMVKNRMFGDLDSYKNKEFFDANTTGTLILPDRTYKLNIFAVMVIPASEHAVFGVTQWTNDASPLLDFAKNNATYFRQSVVENIDAADLKLIALSTCASDFTDARTVVFAAMQES